MRARYRDIRIRVKQRPTWFDEHGAPRYGEFKPEYSPNRYAGECALVRCKCPECKSEFSVEVNGGVFKPWRVLEALVQEGELSVGNPPWHGCRGDAREAVPVRVVEFWHRLEGPWQRLTHLEGAVPEAPTGPLMG